MGHRRRRALVSVLGGGVSFASSMSSLLGGYGLIAWPIADASGASVAVSVPAGYEGVHSNVALAQPTSLPFKLSGLYNGTTSYTNIYSAALNAALNRDAGAVGIIFKIPASVLTDGITRRMFTLYIDSSNYIILQKSLTNNELTCLTVMGGTAKAVSISASSTEYQLLVLCWSKPLNVLWANLNGTQAGLTLTGLGIMAGNLASTAAVIGARTTTPSDVFSGNLAYGFILQSVSSQAALNASLLKVAQLAGVVP